MSQPPMNPESTAAAQRAAVASSVLGGSVEVAYPGAPGERLGGPGTGRPVSAHGDRGERFTAYDPEAFGVPTGREEEWRFTPLSRLRGLHDGTAVADGKLVVEVDAAPEVAVSGLERDDERVGSVLVPTERTAAASLAGFTGGTLVRVPRRVTASRPTVVHLRGEGGTAFGHVFIDVEPEASATVVLDHTGSATFNGNVEVRVADAAALTLVSLQDWDADAVHLGHHVASVGRDAHLKAVHVTLGGELVRINPIVRFAGPGAETDLLGLFFADAGQHLEHRLFVDHDVPRCRSRVTYKGALQGEDAHTVWIGDVLIRAEASGTDTYELNRNLLLTEGARADSVPNLEIETGEVAGAGHASATGRFDDEQLFYLMARGIPERDARRLVVRGFFAEVLAQIGVPQVVERLTAAIEDELAGVGA